MAWKRLNLGILAHVDAGKTTLTERLLYEAGAIPSIGSVDAGTTQTDGLKLERRRGITIQSAVASFTLEDVQVNLVDTPGHPDFIAEVERVLGILDGAVLVVSAVEGVQPQTRILMRALRRLKVPTLILVNKIDRPGASDERTLQAIAQRLTAASVPMGAARGLGGHDATAVAFGPAEGSFATALADVLSRSDDRILAAYVDLDGQVPFASLWRALADQTRRCSVHPVFFGSALTGAGIPDLMAALLELLSPSPAPVGGALSGTAFKVGRGRGGEKIAYVRIFSGSVRTRDRVRFGADLESKVSGIAVFQPGGVERRSSAGAGEIAQVWGLDGVRVGDTIGDGQRAGAPYRFAPPTLESAVAAVRDCDRGRLRIVLAQLAEQDPLIDVRQDDRRHELSVTLYGEVQKEVIQATLENDYGLAVEFREGTPTYVERPIGVGDAIEVLHAESNPFHATMALRVQPGADGGGVTFRLAIDPATAPLYLYKTAANFEARMADYVRESLREGLAGWPVTDCAVTMTECAYSGSDGPPSRRGPRSAAADFRRITPLVLMRALERAGTAVCEPILHLVLEIPQTAIGTVMPAVARLGGALNEPLARGELCCLETVLPARKANDLQRSLAGLTGGEGVLEATFAGYELVRGERPTRPRTTDPRNLAEYKMHLARRTLRAAHDT